ncbi:MAG: cardiolipin synthase ClsB [Thermodesulfobacteriota bacterium]
MFQGKLHRRSLYQAFLPASLSRFVPGNQVTLLRNGEVYFPALEAAFDRAKHEIYLETYIYEDDATGRQIAEALLRAVRRGVKVRVLIDGYGSKDLPQSMLDRLRGSGVKTHIYRPNISPWTFRRKRLRRMHRKITVVDREIAFVGGINIIDDRGPTGDIHPRYDYAVAVEGPLVDEIRLAVQRLWSKAAWRYFRKGAALSGPPLPAASPSGGRMNAALLVRDNISHRRDIETAYLQAIEQAESEIIIANAYFLPGLDFRHVLINAASRGVRVVLLLQGRVEYLLQHYATRALYGNFLDAGIEIYEYRKSFLHAKVAVIDGHWATVGSSNIDPFSLLFSHEANIAVNDEEFGATLSQSLKRTLATDGLRILRDKWKQQPSWVRFMSWLSYGLLRLMMGISSYARENGREKNQQRSAPED